MVLNPVDQVGKAVALRVKIWCVNLVDIAGENDFGIVAGSCHDGFHLMGC